MRFYKQQHIHYCGVDLHKKTMYVYIISHDGETVFHKNLRTQPDEFLRAIAPYRDGLIVAVECMFAWFWLADLCRREGIAFILGHALYMKAVHGTKTKHDREDCLTTFISPDNEGSVNQALCRDSVPSVAY